MSSLAKHVIHQPKPFRCALIVLISIIIISVISWLYLQKTTEHLTSELQSLQQNKIILENHTQQLETSHEQLTQDLITQQQALAVQQATDHQLQQQVSKLQDEIVGLNTELMFYQNITQGSSSSKLQIRELDLRADPIQADIVRYRVVITQGEKISKPITGTVILTLAHSNNSESTTIGEHTLSLRHVQVLEGQVKLADNVKPKTITVTLKRSKKATLSKKFDWHIADNN